MDKQTKAEINECLVRIKKGDNDSLVRLYNLAAHSIRFIALKYLKNEQDAEDLEQDFWADIYDIADGFSYFKNGFGYLCKVMTRMALNRYKKIHGEKSHTVDAVDYNQVLAFDENAAAQNLDDRIAVQKALDKLSQTERLIMQLIIFEDKTIMQIAKELNISKSQVGRIKKKAEEKLKNELSEYKTGKN